MENNIKKRRKKKYPCPNPLFEKWLTEWKGEAAEKGLKTQYTYSKALSSLRKYPLPLSSGKEAKVLEYFGDKICAKLDAKLLEWKQNNSSCNKSVQNGSQSSSDASCSADSNTLLSKASRKPRAASSNVPKNAVDIVVINKGRMHAAKQIYEDKRKSEEQPMESMSDVDVDSFCLAPGCFDVVLCIDNGEAVTGHGRNKNVFISELQKCNVEFEIRKLHVGDFLWVARENSHGHRELVLNFIVERKRMDDLAKSIKDGRFREQKFRMRNCGLKNPIYLVEHYNIKYCGLPEATLEQAIVNTQITDGFLIKRTQNIKESISYLAIMTKLIKSQFQHQTLMSASKEFLIKKKCATNTFMTFNEFNCASVKNKSLTVKEMFAKHLLQFYGLSVDKAAAIVEQFPTPYLFFEAYRKCQREDEQINLISSIKYGALKKNIGPALSRAIHQFYSASGPLI